MSNWNRAIILQYLKQLIKKNMNKIVFTMIIGMIILTGCTEDESMYDIEVVQNTSSTRNSGDCETSYNTTVKFYDAIEILNCRAEEGKFTPCNFVECTSSNGVGTLFIPASDVFMSFESPAFGPAEFWEIESSLDELLTALCNNTYAIIEITFYGEISESGNYNIGFTVSFCCNPIFTKPCEEEIVKVK